MNFDYTLYLVTDRQLMSCDSLTEAVEQAILGGCTMIQLREKELSSLEFYNQAVAVKQVTDKYHIPLIINDRIDIAMAVQATGVHIGQHDLPAAAVRKVIGENMLLGVSASSIAEAIQAQQDGADYLGVGAMFPTGTKTDADSVSMEELQKIRTAVSLPVVVIGGINKGNTGRFKPMGIDGLAVVSAIIAQSDIKAAAAELKDLFCRKEKKHGLIRHFQGLVISSNLGPSSTSDLSFDGVNDASWFCIWLGFDLGTSIRREGRSRSGKRLCLYLALYPSDCLALVGLLWTTPIFELVVGH